MKWRWEDITDELTSPSVRPGVDESDRQRASAPQNIKHRTFDVLMSKPAETLGLEAISGEKKCPDNVQTGRCRGGMPDLNDAEGVVPISSVSGHYPDINYQQKDAENPDNQPTWTLGHRNPNLLRPAGTNENGASDNQPARPRPAPFRSGSTLFLHDGRVMHRFRAVEIPAQATPDVVTLLDKVRRVGVVLVADGMELHVVERWKGQLHPRTLRNLRDNAGAVITVLRGEHRERVAGLPAECVSEFGPA
jgi:hypothetical protein